MPSTQCDGADRNAERRFQSNVLSGGLVGRDIVIAITKFEFLSRSTWVLAAGLVCVVGALLLVGRFRAT